MIESTSRNVDLGSFSQLSDPFNRLALRVADTADWMDNDTAWRIFRGEYTPSQPLTFYGYMGGRPMDFIWSGHIALFCVAERVIELFRSNGLTGWKTYPVKVFDRKKQPVPGYSGLSLVGHPVTLDKSRSVEVKIQYEAPHMPEPLVITRPKGLYFVEKDWDGSDFFPCRGFILVSQRAAEVLKEAEVKNIKLTPLPEVILEP